jgi:tetratricopeptide (TPR) repeat protein
VRCQLLGSVEARADNRRTAEAALLIRATMLGADAVVDIQEEALPDFRRTVRRLTGMAVRAVDADGQFEFRSRWCADRIARISGSALVLTLITALLLVPSSALRAAGGGSVTAASAVSILALLLWPVLIAMLALHLRWPQLIGPLALTLESLAAAPFLVMAGAATGAFLWGGGSIDLIVQATWVLISPDLALFVLIAALNCVVFAFFLASSARRVDREFRRLVPAGGRKAPFHRTLAGALIMVAAVTYPLLLVLLPMRQDATATTRSLTAAPNPSSPVIPKPVPVDQRPGAADREFQAGARFFRSDPATAAGHFRKARALWETLVSEAPARVDYRIHLAATQLNLGNLLVAEGRLDEAENQIAAASRHIETVSARSLPMDQRARVNQIRVAAQSFECNRLMHEGLAHRKAGDDVAAEASYRRALESLEASGHVPSLAPAQRDLRSRNEAAARNGVAWLLALMPDRRPEQYGEAVTLAERAVALEPNNGSYWNTLGLGRYLVRDYSGASSALERSVPLRGGGNVYEWVVRAMICWRQDDRAGARKWLDVVTTLIEQQNPPGDDLRRLHAEAAALIRAAPPEP